MEGGKKEWRENERAKEPESERAYSRVQASERRKGEREITRARTLEKERALHVRTRGEIHAYMNNPDKKVCINAFTHVYIHACMHTYV